MKLYPVKALTLGLLCAMSGPVLAADYHVSASGTTNNVCSAANPCRQIRHAIPLAKAGDNILVADGQYLGFTMSSKSGTAASPITIKATGSNAQILPTTDRSDNRDNILLSHSDHVVIDGLKTFNAPRSGLRLDQSHNVKITNSTLGNNTTWGIFTNHSNDVVIEKNDIYGSKNQHGVYLSNSGDRPIVRENTLYNNKLSGVQLNADLSTGGGRNVVGDGLITGAVIERNTIYGNGTGGAAGINLDGVQDSVVRNNLLYDNHSSGIALFKIDGAAGPKNVDVSNNTIDMAADGRWAIRVTQSAGQVATKDNILINRNTSRGGISLAFQSSGLSNADLSNLISDGNIFDKASYAVTPNDDLNRYYLSSWQSYFNQDLNSVTYDPDLLFADLNARDYHLLPGSPTAGADFLLASVEEPPIEEPPIEEPPIEEPPIEEEPPVDEEPTKPGKGNGKPDKPKGKPLRSTTQLRMDASLESAGLSLDQPLSTAAAVPEPATLLLFGAGAVGAMLQRKRKA